MSNLYFDIIPPDLTSIIISYLSYDDFNAFVQFFDSGLFDPFNTGMWGYIFFSHFGFHRKNMNQKEHLMWLSMENFKEIFKLGKNVQEPMDNVKAIILSNNHITNIPGEIGLLINLRFLNLSHNQIKNIPLTIAGLANLEVLNLSYNQIIDIPLSISSLQNLRILNLTHNQIEDVPHAISYLKNLEELLLEGNYVTEVPEEVENLKFHRLRHLTLYYSPIDLISSQLHKLKKFLS
jgi:hypothetical protein